MKSLRIFLALFLCHWAAVSGSARELTETEAMAVAQSDIAARSLTPSTALVPAAGKGSGSVATLRLAARVAAPKTAGTALYVFNRTDAPGFVVVSGETDFGGVVGYSDRGTWPEEKSDIPEGMDWLLQAYAEQVEAVRNGARRNTPVKHAEAIEPLLETAWNQMSPYNRQCPKKDSTNCVVGCGAIVMGQTMRYHRWPTSATGTNTYTTATEKIDVSFDFSTMTFDYDNMPASLTNSSPQAQIDAVANLLFGAGVSVNMNYRAYPYSSSSTFRVVAEQLINRFKYDKGMGFREMEYYTTAEWDSILTAELKAGRPIIYQGIGPSLAHVFMCDGVNTSGLFHINWGWGGYCDGYFDIAALKADGRELTSYLWALCGVQPAKSGSTSYQALVGGEANTFDTTILKGKAIKPGVKYVEGMNLVASKVNLSYVLYNFENRQRATRQIFDGNVLFSAPMDNLYEASHTIAKTLKNGHYEFRPCYKFPTDKQWRPLNLRGGEKGIVYIDAFNDSARVYTDRPQFQATDIVLNAEEKTLTCLLRGGERTYLKDVTLELVGPGQHFKMSIPSERLTAGKEKSVTFTNLPALSEGTYSIFIMDNTRRCAGYAEVAVADPTGIESVTLQHGRNAGAAYDLLGRPLRPGTHGVRIENGRKVIK